MTAPFPYDLLDLTHTLDNQIPTWDMRCGFKHDLTLDYEDFLSEVKFRIQKIDMLAGVGTHMDAPLHIASDGCAIDEIPVEKLISPCVCIDVSQHRREDYVVSLEDVLLFEKQHRPIPKNSFVIFYTGWDTFWTTPNMYHNNLQFPSISEDVALHLLKRNITGLGIDTLSPDVGASQFPVHKHILEAGKYIVENVANAKALPALGAFVLVCPIKGRGLTESPIRLLGLKTKSASSPLVSKRHLD